MFSKCGWSVGDLAEALGVGQRSFARVVGESLGITGQVWLCRLRAVVACHLLREGGKIRPIARQLGFNDDSNFTREFKKIVGVLPSHYIAGERTRSEMD